MNILDWARTKPKASRKPARGWRNWYRAVRDHDHASGFRRAGDEICGTEVWPSKEIAETNALGCVELATVLSDLTGDTAPIEYIGTREDGENG